MILWYNKITNHSNAYFTQRRSAEMTEKKRRFSIGHIFLGLGILAAIGFAIITFLMIPSTDAAHGCTPWCFDACPWCWLIIDIAAVALFGIVPFFVIMKSEAMKKEEAIATEEAPATSKHHFHMPLLHIPHLHLPQHHHRHKRVKHGKQYDATVTLASLMTAFTHDERVTLSVLKSKGLVDPKAKGYKVLLQNNEELDRPLTIYASSFSQQAKEAIVKAGGKAIMTHA